jgi:NAD(P)-dependent dehydrogenase (short-subunit alcohol dehydrogenase family)
MSTPGPRLRALVTGGNRGIGLALCGVLAERGYTVVATCRRTSPELDALGVTVVEGVDVGEPAAADHMRAAIGNRPVDLVVVNAAQNRSFDIDRPDDLDLALFEDDVRVNVVGAIRTVLAALPNMDTGSRVLLVSSGVVAPGNNVPGSFGYKVTKAALNQFGRALAQELRSREIIVATVTPGPTNTAMLRASHAAGRTVFDPADAPEPRVSARRLLDVVEAATLETSGSFWNFTGDAFLGPDGLPPAG